MSELAAKTIGKAELANYAARAGTEATAKGQAQVYVAPGEPIREQRTSGNAICLLTGEHGGFRLQVGGTLVYGAPGAVVGRQVVCAADAVLSGLHFASRPNGNTAKAALLLVAAGATVRLEGCTFERGASDTSDWITVESGAKLHVVGCAFIGTPSVGDCIANAGPAANVGVWASNKTGRPIGAATTAIFITT